MILMIDNYDSFTFNLVQYLGELGQEVQVYRNDQISVKEIELLNPQAIVISPGPRTPNEAGISMTVIQALAGRLPILGVCLGHQAIAQVFGGQVVRAEMLMHGKTSEIIHDGQSIYAGLPNPFTATRYHSLIISREYIPPCLEITAQTCTGEVMGLRHRDYLVEGVQFHPESIMTRTGKHLLKNFIELTERRTPNEHHAKGY